MYILKIRTSDGAGTTFEDSSHQKLLLGIRVNQFKF